MAKAQKRKAKKAKRQDAIDLLKRDHADVKKAFKEFEKAKYKDPRACKDFLASICRDLEMHTTLEEEIFYPAVRGKIKDDDLMNEAQVEHNSAKQLIAEIEKLGGDDPMLKAHAQVAPNLELSMHIDGNKNDSIGCANSCPILRTQQRKSDISTRWLYEDETMRVLAIVHRHGKSQLVSIELQAPLLITNEDRDMVKSQCHSSALGP